MTCNHSFMALSTIKEIYEKMEDCLTGILNDQDAHCRNTDTEADSIVMECPK